MNVLKFLAAIGLSASILTACAHGKMGNVDQQLTTGALNKSEMIYVMPIDTNSIELSGDHSKDAATVDKIKKTLNDKYRQEVVTQLHKEGFTAATAEKKPAKGKVLMGKVTKIENGSAAARWFVGMGAGSANMFTNFELTDGAKSLTKFQVIGTSGGSSAMGSFLENHIMDSAKKTAEYLSKANSGTLKN